jgi:putative ATP-dependent endonuclease of OLD family
MSFIKAYAEVFKSGATILGIEEPEAHLHPLAQRWLAKNIKNMSQSGVQVVITTHSPEFLDIEGLEGFVKVYKQNGITKSVQNSSNELAEKCVLLKANPQKTSSESILPFYKANTFYDQLKGFFAKKIIFVEGPSELFSLPNYFTNCGYDLIKNGVEIVDCRGKDQIARNYRLFKAYEYDCYCLFDGDEGAKNQELAGLFDFETENMELKPNSFTSNPLKEYGYFGKDLENYMKTNFPDYENQESQIEGTKPLKAKIISEQNTYQPCFIEEIAKTYASKIKVVKVNVDDSPDSARKYGVRGIPTLIVFNNGEAGEAKVGALTKSQLTIFLDSNI